MDKAEIIRVLRDTELIFDSDEIENITFLELDEDGDSGIFDTSSKKIWYVSFLSDKVSIFKTPKAAVYGTLACNTLNNSYEAPVAFSFSVDAESGTGRFAQITAIPEPEKQSVDGMVAFVREAIMIHRKASLFLSNFIASCQRNELSVDDCFVTNSTGYSVAFHPLLKDILEKLSEEESE